MTRNMVYNTPLYRLRAMGYSANHSRHSALERLSLMADAAYDVPDHARRAMLE